MATVGNVSSAYVSNRVYYVKYQSSVGRRHVLSPGLEDQPRRSAACSGLFPQLYSARVNSTETLDDSGSARSRRLRFSFKSEGGRLSQWPGWKLPADVVKPRDSFASGVAGSSGYARATSSATAKTRSMRRSPCWRG